MDTFWKVTTMMLVWFMYNKLKPACHEQSLCSLTPNVDEDIGVEMLKYVAGVYHELWSSHQ